MTYTQFMRHGRKINFGHVKGAYKGEDIVETILRFAREYRVGHIIIGKPGPLPFFQRWLGRKTLAERLILQAQGVHIVVVDTEVKPESELYP